MTTDAVYDRIAKEYRDSKLLPFRRHVEEHTIFGLLPALAVKRVLDLACGEGISTCRLIERGAKDALGVDISLEMIKLAEGKERDKPLGARYAIGNGTALATLGAFDVVLGSYLLNYAPSAEELVGFCGSIERNLARRGRFVGFNDNRADDPKNHERNGKYGFVKKSKPAGEQRTGDPMTYTLFNPDGTSFNCDNYFVEPSAFSEVVALIGRNGAGKTTTLRSIIGIAPPRRGRVRSAATT